MKNIIVTVSLAVGVLTAPEETTVQVQYNNIILLK